MAADSIIGAGLCESPYTRLHDQLSELAMRNRELREENERLRKALERLLGGTTSLEDALGAARQAREALNAARGSDHD